MPSLTAAGLKYASGIVRTGPEPGRPPGTNSCGGPVGPQSGSVPPVVLLTVGEQQVRGTATSHGVPYDRSTGESPADAVVTFPAARLKAGGPRVGQLGEHYHHLVRRDVELLRRAR